MYADDTNVTFSAATIPDLESQINSDLKYIDRWLKANKLSLNVAKTEFMVISSRQKLQSLNDYTMSIHIDGVPINRSNQSKSLGLIIDENLSLSLTYTNPCNKQITLLTRSPFSVFGK